MTEKFRIVELSNNGKTRIKEENFNTYLEAVKHIKNNLLAGTYNIEKIFIKN